MLGLWIILLLVIDRHQLFYPWFQVLYLLHLTVQFLNLIHGDFIIGLYVLYFLVFGSQNLEDLFVFVGLFHFLILSVLLDAQL